MNRQHSLEKYNSNKNNTNQNSVFDNISTNFNNNNIGGSFLE